MENKKIVWQKNKIEHIIEARNVGNKNKEATIQIIYTRWDIWKERHKPTIFIDIPKEKCEEFINAIKPKDD